MQFQPHILKRKFLQTCFPGRALSYGLNWALAGRGVVVQDKAFQNLTSSELQQKGATIAESLSGLPVHVRGNLLGGYSDISKAQYSRLLKQITTHLSSISNIFVQDGAIGSSSQCDAKVRVISDSPSAVLKLSSILWKTPNRAVSHDSCPLTVYVAASISPGVGDAVGLGDQGNSGFISADIERSSLILCGKAFSDVNGIKEALAALSGPIITARGGLLLSARLLVSCDSVILLFAPEDTIQSCANLLVSADPGVILSSQGVMPLFQTGNTDGPDTFKLPSAILLASSDSSGIIPSVAKLSPGQAAYHFLAGYQDGKFVPAYSKFLYINALELAKAFLSKLKDHQIWSYLVNVKKGETSVTGKDLSEMVQSMLSKNIPPFEPKGSELQEKYKIFLSGKFGEIPKEFSF
ncbi:Phosphoenolpyruvate carboxykinase (ATP) [Melia azedarach]|uniref:Phosphoenolpyruvate carboxykinase (ATP) n=2 Tax=Melia azedarach TaxID=155640 RepID=A0ACC1YDS6_MELAZ|nr:Phosphoenolpyruvate carboxykinase (ATP) [Melia azedarach]KAJ4721095.1 Phosphoenolpyruvate carboxykinase (ATP) [Melia azedarach]